MTSKKRKYGDLSARPLPTEDPSLIDDVFAAFTGRPAPAVALEEGVPQSGIPSEPTPPQSMPPDGIPRRGILESEATAQKPQVKVRAERGYYPTFNDLDDKLIPDNKLDTFEQSILRRLYRLSRGFKSIECEAGLGALSKACNMSRSQAQKTINSLLTRGLIHSLGHSQAGTRYRVLDMLPAVPPKSIPREGIPEDGGGVPQESQRGIPQGGNNKKNKDLENTHTNTVGVRVGSRFTVEECKRYAEHLRSTGQGINNPGGYATTIHRTGEADALIEVFLNPAAPQGSADFSGCPDCQGSGFWYPDGLEKGVKKCRHDKLTDQAGSGA